MRANLLTFALLLVLPAVASASQVPIGLDWGENVFVQEYWQDGKARYAIFNNRLEAIDLTVNDVQFTKSFRVDGKDLVTWKIERKQVVYVDAPKAPAGDGVRYLGFRIVDGKRLGVLTIPVTPPDLPKGKVISSDGINGSGGRYEDVWYEQDSLTFKSDGVIELRLKLPANGATVTFKKKKSMDNPIIEAIITEAACATLPVQAGKEEITIDTGKPLKEVAVHVVTLRFMAPKVDAPTMVRIDGWVSLPPKVPGALSGGSTGFVRGVIVQPGK